MGIDIYLCHSEDWNNSYRIMSYQKEVDKIKDRIPADQHNEYTKLKAVELGIKTIGEDFLRFDTGIREVEHNSTMYPDHLWKIGYFRSSYNSSGINFLLENLNLPRLNDILGIYSECEYHKIDWKTVWKNAHKVKEDLQIKALPNGYKLVHVINIKSNNPYEEARACIEDLQDLKTGVYMTKGGTVFGFNYKLLAVIGEFLLVEDLDHKDENAFDFYIECLDILIETCEFVMSQPDPFNYRLQYLY